MGGVGDGHGVDTLEESIVAKAPAGGDTSLDDSILVENQALDESIATLTRALSGDSTLSVDELTVVAPIIVRVDVKM